MIQIATVGDTQVVVKEGLKKILPDKLYILHTANEKTKSEFDDAILQAKKEKNTTFVKILQTKQYEENAKKLKKEIQDEFHIKVELRKVGKFDSYDVIREIRQIVTNEINESGNKLNSKDFSINITGGTKAMVAGAACAAYLVQSKMYYVLHPDEARGQELVRELPVPSRVRRRSTISGSTENATSIVLQKIGEIGKTNNKHLLEVLKDEKIPTEKIIAGKSKPKVVFKKFTAQKLNYHLNKLEDAGVITRQRGWLAENGKKNRKLVTIELTDTGRLYATAPETIGDLL